MDASIVGSAARGSPPLGSAGLAAVLFDMDGLLVDNEEQWCAAEARVVRDLGAEWGKQQQIDLLGSNLAYAAEYMVAFAGSNRPVSEVMDLLLTYASEELSRRVEFRPGALDLIELLSKARIPVALVTSSVRVHVDAVLQHLPNDPFVHRVTADDVDNLKPHPEPYLTALELLGVPPQRTIVLEDSPTGVAAAEAAGCRVVAVPSVVSIDPAPGRTVWPTLEGATLDSLRSVIDRT